MAILVMMDVPGMTLDQFDEMNRRLGIETADDLPDGCLAHAAGETDDGLEVIDVWESPEALGDFVENRLVPSSEGVADLSNLQPRVLPVHNRIHAGSGQAAGVLIVMDIPDMGTDDYDRVTAEIPAHAGDGSAHPAVSHTAAATEDGGILVVDVWESPEHFQRFAEEHLAPAMPDDAPPIEPRVVPLHTHFSAHSPATASR